MAMSLAFGVEGRTALSAAEGSAKVLTENRKSSSLTRKSSRVEISSDLVPTQPSRRPSQLQADEIEEVDKSVKSPTNAKSTLRRDSTEVTQARRLSRRHSAADVAAIQIDDADASELFAHRARIDQKLESAADTRQPMQRSRSDVDESQRQPKVERRRSRRHSAGDVGPQALAEMPRRGSRRGSMTSTSTPMLPLLSKPRTPSWNDRVVSIGATSRTPLPPIPGCSRVAPSASGESTNSLAAATTDAPADGKLTLRQKLAHALEINEHDQQKIKYSVAKRQADAALAHRDWEAAEKHLTTAIDVHQNNPVLYSSRSFACLRQRKDVRALEDAKTATELDTLSANGYYRQGRVLTCQERYSEAGAMLLQASEREPNGIVIEEHFHDLLGTIRRARPFFPGRPKPPPRILASTPPATARPPMSCRKPSGEVIDHDTLQVTWEVVPDDGDDDVYKYEVQMALVDPVRPRDDPQFECVYEGIAEWSVTVDGLLPDNEYIFRVAAHNSKGRGSWSEELRLETRREGDPNLVQQSPPAWLALKANMDDLFTEASRLAGDGWMLEAEWAACVDAMRQRMTPIKLAFRFYSLLGSTDDNPDDMSMSQFRLFVKDCRIQAKGIPPAAIDNAFMRANREVAGAEAVSNDANDDHKLMQHEFVGALLRLAMLRYKLLMSKSKSEPVRRESRRTDPSEAADEQTGSERASASVPRSTLEDEPDEPAGIIGQALHMLVEQHVEPFMVKIDENDPVTLALNGRACKAVRMQYEEKLVRALKSQSSIQKVG